MAAATVSRTERHSFGNLTNYVITFSSVADGDTYASGLGGNVVGYWANSGTVENTSAQSGVNISESSGTFTFQLKTTSTTLKLFILATT